MDGGKRMQIAEYQESTNAWTSMEVKLPPCDKLKNFAVSLEVYSPFQSKIFAFDSFRFKNCNSPKVFFLLLSFNFLITINFCAQSCRHIYY